MERAALPTMLESVFVGIVDITGLRLLLWEVLALLTASLLLSPAIEFHR